MQLIGDADDQGFRFVRIELESVLQVPPPDVSANWARTASLSDVLLACMVRRSWVSSAYWWCWTPWLAITSATGLQYTANNRGPRTDAWGTPMDGW